VLRVALYVTAEGMVHRLASDWKPLTDEAPFAVWDEIV
jgi:hypothetical protein